MEEQCASRRPVVLVVDFRRKTIGNVRSSIGKQECLVVEIAECLYQFTALRNFRIRILHLAAFDQHHAIHPGCGVAASVLRVSVAIAEPERQSGGENVFKDRPTDRAVHIERIVVAGGHPETAVVSPGRSLGVNFDGPRRGAPVVPRPLRTSENVDALDVEQRAELERRRVLRHVVEDDRDGAGRVRVEVVQPDPADEECRSRCPRSHDLEIRRKTGQICDALRAESV